MVAKYLFQFLFIILSPSYWCQISRVNSVLDKELNILLNNGTKFTNINHHTAHFGPFILWVANHPYASFSNYRRDTGIPKRYTRHLLMKRLQESDSSLSG